jgi:hypothetical protein
VIFKDMLFLAGSYSVGPATPWTKKVFEKCRRVKFVNAGSEHTLTLYQRNLNSDIINERTSGGSNVSCCSRRN